MGLATNTFRKTYSGKTTSMRGSGVSTPYWLVSKIKEQEKKYKEKKAKKLQEAKIARLENTQ